MRLPKHCAQDDEPIPVPRVGGLDGPDMRFIPSVSVMLAELRDFSDDVGGYVDCWLGWVSSCGCQVSCVYEWDGSLELFFSVPCDGQVRHRSRWMHFLCEDLRQLEERREWLKSHLLHEGRYADNRPTSPRLTTRAMRNFLRMGGRILIDPRGRLTEGGSMPHDWFFGPPELAKEIGLAFRAYFLVRRRWRADAQIKRAVRMLGERTHNGWLMLGERPTSGYGGIRR